VKYIDFLVDFIAGNSTHTHKKKKKKKNPKIGFGFGRKISVGPSICSHLGNGIGYGLRCYGLKVWTMGFATKQRVLT